MHISSGNKELDDWLSGGYETDIITTFYGPAGSGKTNLCLLAAVEQAKKGSKVLFIDTEGGFSVERLKQLSSESIMKNIILLKVTNFSEQKEILNKLSEEIKKNISLIIVDSMVMLYRLYLGIAREDSDKEKAHKLIRNMAWQLKTLSEIARKKNIPIIITDQVYSDFLSSEKLNELIEKGKNIDEEKSQNVRMVGGDLIRYWSKCIIELKRVGSKRRAVLRKHRSLPEKEFSFVITGKGIAKAGWLF